MIIATFYTCYLTVHTSARRCCDHTSSFLRSLDRSDGVKDTDGKAKAKDIQFEVEPKSLRYGDHSLWRDVMSELELVLAHQTGDENASLFTSFDYHIID